MKVDDIHVSWVIPTFDRRIKGPFPLPSRYYQLDWTKASESDRAEIIRILGISDNSNKEEFVGFGKQSVTFSVGANKPDERMLRFRQMFVEKSIEDVKELTSDSKRSYRVFKGVNIHREYFEDETGREISFPEMVQIATGRKNAIPFDCEYIVQLGPCPICAKEKWSVDKSNTLFNFIQVVRLIWRSSWARKKASVTTHFINKEHIVVGSDFPAVESMCAVLTLFRQLYARDALMKNACEIYEEHCSNATRKEWVVFCRKEFKQRLDGNPFLFFHLQGCSVKQLFNAFLYGTGIVHSPIDRNRANRKTLSMLVKQYGREKVMMAVNESFWMVLKYAVDVFHVVKQDYEYWTEQGGCAKSDMFDIYSLLQSHSP